MSSIINKSILHKPSFEKLADYTLPKDTSTWTDDIFNKFYDEVPYMSDSVVTDIVMDHLDENKGYAKGSLVATSGNKKINFPIIVNNYKLSPFDVFVMKNGNEYKYMNATNKTISEALVSEDIGKVDYKGDKTSGSDIKLPGGISQKTATPAVSGGDIGSHPMSKMSSFKESDFDYLEDVISKTAGMKESFTDTTGDLITNIVSLKNDKKILNNSATGKIKPSSMINAKRAYTILDSQITNSNDLKLMVGSTLCELRLNQYPAMEDFMEHGYRATERLIASGIGKSISGIIVNTISSGSYKSNETNMSSKAVFISADGKYTSKSSGINNAFYGYKISDDTAALIATARIIKDSMVDSFSNSVNMNTGADKKISPNAEMNQGSFRSSSSNDSLSDSLLCMYSDGSVFSGIEFNGSFRRYKTNGSYVYVSRTEAIIPANILSAQRVGSVSDPAYKMIIGSISNIFLVPETSVVINLSSLSNINPSKFITPENSCESIIEKNASKVSLSVSGGGYKITGNILNPLEKIAGIKSDAIHTRNDVSNILGIMGMSKEASDNAMRVLVEREFSQRNSNVDIYGLNESYINNNIYDNTEKTAALKPIYKSISDELKADLIKEASIINDPESVEVMLSLNFINEDNVGLFVDEIYNIDRIKSKLCGMLIASRLGLAELDQSGLKSAILGLDKTLSGLKGLKIATSKSIQ